jgi:hypothetical protein
MSPYFQNIQQKTINPDSIARVGASWGKVLEKAGNIISGVITENRENKKIEETANAIIKLHPEIGEAFDGDAKKLGQSLKRGGLGPIIQLEQLKNQKAQNAAQLEQIKLNALYKREDNARAANADARANAKASQERTQFVNDQITNWLKNHLNANDIEGSRAKVLDNISMGALESSNIAGDVFHLALHGSDEAFKNYMNNLKGVKTENKTVEKKADGTVVTTTGDSTGNTSVTVDGTAAGYGTKVSLSEAFKNEPTVLADLKQAQLLNAVPGSAQWNMAQEVVNQAKEREQGAVKFVSDSIRTSPLGTKENLAKLQATKSMLYNFEKAKELNNINLATAAVTGFIRMFETGVLTDSDQNRYQNQGWWENQLKLVQEATGNVDVGLMDKMMEATKVIYEGLVPDVRKQLENHINSASKQFRIQPDRLNEILPFTDIPALMAEENPKPQNTGVPSSFLDNLTD